MEIVTYCPLSVGTLVWERQPGDFRLTVCVKATFALRDGQESALAPRQEVIGDDAYWEGNAAGSLYSPSDLAPEKPRADVVVIGHARAPGGGPVESLVARVRVDDFSKALRVTGDRAWQVTRDGLRPGPVRPFSEMPLRYERGSLQGDSLAGVLPAPSLGRALANLEILDEAPARWAGQQLGARTPGFGPIAPAWRARRGRLGEEALRWAAQVRGGGAVPAGFDFGYFNVAPIDQQVEVIRGAPTVVLENLHRQKARFETRLAAVNPRVHRQELGGQRTEVVLKCDTLWIDADRELAVLSWRGAVALSSADEAAVGRLIVSNEVSAKLEARAAAPAEVEDRTGAFAMPRLDAGLPFARPASEGSAARPMTIDRALPFRPVSGPPAAIEVEEDDEEDEPTPPPREAPVVQRREPRDPIPEPEEPSGRHRVPLFQLGGGMRSADAATQAAAAIPPAAVDASIARWAEVSLELASGRVDTGALLGRLGLGAEQWAAVGESWRAQLVAEAEHGDAHLVLAHDAAYVNAVERLRGPITAEQYARLVVGHEQGSVAAALAELKMPRGALLPVEREWARRISGDAALAEQVERAVSRARAG